MKTVAVIKRNSDLKKLSFYRNNYLRKTQNLLPLVQLVTSPLKKELFNHRLHGLLRDSTAIKTFIEHECFVLVQRQILLQTLAKKLIIISSYRYKIAQKILIKRYAMVFESMCLNLNKLPVLSAPEAAIRYLKNTRKLQSSTPLEISAFCFFDSSSFLSEKILNYLKVWGVNTCFLETYFQREKMCNHYLKSLLLLLCGVDINQWGEACNIGLFSLNQKLFLWDAIAREIEQKNCW